MGNVGDGKKVYRAAQIGQMAALRYKTQMESKNVRREKIEKILENKMPGMKKEIPKRGI